MRRQYCLLILTLIGCGILASCSIGPQVATRFVLVKPGHPLLILDNVEVTGKRLDDEATGQQDIGGWVAMPVEHFEALKRAVERANQTPASPAGVVR